jgi:hypothetical protein
MQREAHEEAGASRTGPYGERRIPKCNEANAPIVNELSHLLPLLMYLIPSFPTTRQLSTQKPASRRVEPLVSVVLCPQDRVPDGDKPEEISHE